MLLFHRLKNHWRLSIILIIYLVIATAHSLVVPFTTGNDEWAHFLYARFITEHGRLPINLAERQDRDEVGTKSDDPPLYHLVVAAVTSAMDLEPTRLLRPVNSEPRRQLADNFVVSFAFLVHNAYESIPYRGEVLLWHIGRTLSTLFGAVLIILTYLTGLELFSNRCRHALVAATVLAFMPAFIFHNSVMTYDGLGAIFTALFLLAGIKAIKNPTQWRWWLALGALGGLAITTKYSSVLLPLEIVFISWLASRTENDQPWISLPFVRITVAGVIMILATSWWFGFVIWHFNTIDTRGPIIGILEPLLIRGGNDSTAISVTASLLGEEAVSVDLPPPARERNYPHLASIMAQSFWSAPIAEKFPPWVSPWLTLIFVGAMLLAIAGLWRIWRNSSITSRIWLILLLFHTLLISPLILMRVFISFDPLEAVQGRHILFPAASAIAILLTWGWEQWGNKVGQFFAAGLLLWSTGGQLGWAAAVYPPPLPVWVGEKPETEALQFEGVNPILADGMQFLGYSWRETAGASSLEVALWWKAQAIMHEDYLVEIRLLDDADNVVSYTVGHPVQGRYPTRAWEMGDIIKDTRWLPLTMPLNGTYRLELDLLDYAGNEVGGTPISLGQVTLTNPGHSIDPCAVWFQGQPNHGGLLIQPYRLRSTFTVVGPELPTLVPLSNQSKEPTHEPFVSMDDWHIFKVGANWSERYQLVVGSKLCHQLAFDLFPRNFSPPEIPNPLTINFNNEVQLLGYELPTRRIQPGERLPLALYWQALSYVGEDYQIFDNLLDSEQRRWGGYDRRAQDGYSTLLWEPGEFITDRFGVPIDPAAPDGIYTLDLGWYQKSEGGAISLPLFVANEPTEQSSFRLGPIKVGGPPPGVTIKNPTPQRVINQLFGGQITLLGYDLARPTVDPNNQDLKLTLYWQANTIPTADYTTFFHLRNSNEELIAQKDQPPANGGYPTSLWDVGEIVIDEIILPVGEVPPDEYTLVIGLYDSYTSAPRLSVEGNPYNELELESITLP